MLPRYEILVVKNGIVHIIRNDAMYVNGASLHVYVAR